MTRNTTFYSAPAWRLPAMALTVLALAVALVPSGALASHETTLVMEEYYLDGHEHDQLHKSARLAPTTLDPTTPTFTQVEPDGDTIRQSSSNAGRMVPNGEYVGNPLALYWIGEFTGEVGGLMSLRLQVETLNPYTAVAKTQPLHIRVWADPDWEAGAATKVLGGIDRHEITVDPLAVTPVTIDIPVWGSVERQIVVQVTPIADMGNGIGVLYGSADHPSGFSLPTRVPIEH